MEQLSPVNSQTSSARASFRTGSFPEDAAGSGIKSEQKRPYRDEGKEVQIKVENI